MDLRGMVDSIAVSGVGGFGRAGEDKRGSMSRAISNRGIHIRRVAFGRLSETGGTAETGWAAEAGSTGLRIHDRPSHTPTAAAPDIHIHGATRRAECLMGANAWVMVRK